MNEHVSLMAEQYDMGADKDGAFITFNGRVSKDVQGGLQQRKVEVKTIIRPAIKPSMCGEIVQRILELHSKHWPILQEATSKHRTRRCQVWGAPCWNKYFIKLFAVDVQRSQDKHGRKTFYQSFWESDVCYSTV